MNRFYLIIVVLLGIIALGSFWLVHYDHNNQQANSQKLVSAYATHIRTIEFDPQGHINRELFAEKLEQYDTTKTTLLIQPKLIYYSNQQPVWVVTAHQGIIKHPLNHQIELNDQVIVERFASADNGAMTLTTSKLIIDPQDKKAYTDQKVTIKQAESLTHAQGMRCDLQTGRIQLLSNIRSEYRPSRH